MRIFLYIGCKGVSIHVGSGSFTEVTDFAARFAGSYGYLSFKGQVNVAMELKDHNRDASSGPCSMTVMDATDDNARYQVQGDKLAINTKLNADAIQAYQYKGGTEFDCPTLPTLGKTGVWIGP
jgi:hypothetical protein